MNNLSNTPKYVKVMIIDDTQIDRYIAEFVIKKNNFAGEIIVKESAKKGLEYLLSMADKPAELPTYIFLDIRMPEMDGFGFLDEYQNLPVSIQNSCIIMMLSTSLDEEDHKRASENKFVKKFLNKPLDKEKLAQM